MSAKPEAESRSTFHAVIDLLISKTGFVLVCVAVTVTGLVKWRDLVELFHGQKDAAAADKGKPELPPLPPVLVPGPGPKLPLPPVVPPNAAPTVRAKPDAVAFGPDDLTKRVELAIEDEDPSKVVVTAVLAAGGTSGLVPPARLKVSGTGATRFLDVFIDPDKWGSATVRLTATDRERLAGEATLKVTVPAPALVIAAIPDVSVTAGEPLPIIPVTVEDAARRPAKVAVTAVANDPLFPADGVTLDKAGEKLTLAPKPKARGTAAVTLVAQADDGREARRSFKVTVLPPPLRAGGKATVVVALAEGSLDFDARGLNKVLGSPALDRGATVGVKEVQGKRCRIEWTAGGDTHVGWVDAAVLSPVDDQ